MDDIDDDDSEFVVVVDFDDVDNEVDVKIS